MSKYIVEIKPEYEDSFNGLMILGAKDNDLFVDALAVDDLELLNSDYINEHFGDLQDTAYQRGLDDAWEVARKIFGYEIDGGIPIDKVGRVFGYSEDATFCTADIIRHNTASEAIAKLKAYEEKQNDKFEVGDEFVTSTGKRFVVLRVDENGEVDRYFDSEGKTYRMNVKYLSMKKTGRHFDIASILEDMRND